MAGFLPGYYSSLASNDSKKRYSDKVKLVDGIDPYRMNGKMMLIYGQQFRMCMCACTLFSLQVPIQIMIC